MTLQKEIQYVRDVVARAERIVITHESGHDIALVGELRQMLLDGLDALAEKKGRN